MEADVLRTLGNVPVTTSQVASLYPELKRGLSKVSGLEHSGQVVRLKRGLYVVNPRYTGKPLSIELIANHLYTPSYISRHSALRLYGLIPETVYTMQSMTVKHSRSFDNALGHFEYLCTSRECFHIGLSSMSRDGISFIIASAEKALCDLVATSPLVNLRYPREAERFLEEDLRLDMDALKDFDPEIFRQCVLHGKKPLSIKSILKLIEK